MSTNTQGEKRCCDQCERKTGFSPAGSNQLICKNPSCPCHHSTPAKEGWEKRFDLMYGLAPVGSLKGNKAEEIKSFIRTTRADLLKEIEGEFEKTRKNEEISGRGMLSAIAQADAEYQNKVLDGFLTIIHKHLEE